MGDNEELIQRIKEIKWFHSIPIRDGIVTPGFDNSMDKLGQVCLPEDLKGKSVLDIGAWDGFFSFQAEKNGAERVCSLPTTFVGADLAGVPKPASIWFTRP